MSNQTLTHTSGFHRLPQVLERIPVGKSTWWRWVKEGKAPKGIKIAANTTVWPVEVIDKLVDDLKEGRA